MVGKFLIALALLVPVAGAAQSAKVIVLSDADAAEAKSLHRKLQEILDKQKALESKIKAKYIVAAHDKNNGGICGTDGCYDSEWGSGFEYSEDFRFVVPVPARPYNGNSMLNCVIPTFSNGGIAIAN